MPLDACPYQSDTGVYYVPGTVLFDTNPPPHSYPHSYHVMLIREGITETRAGGHIWLPVCDMTLGGIRFPPQGSSHKIRSGCYIGKINNIDAESSRQIIEELESLLTDPSATGQVGEYSLATHGIHLDDPNNPGEKAPGVFCSCASLVEWCYEAVSDDIDLVSENDVPSRTPSELWSLLMRGEPYDPVAAEEKISNWGLKGEGPWKVLLPAYQMAAFSSDLFPYKPSVEDHPFSLITG